MKRVGPKRVSLFEAGAGKIPLGLIDLALKSKEKRRGRTFFASDIEFKKEEILRARGLRTIPSNLRLVNECSLKELKMLPKESMDIIFESYFLNKFMWDSKKRLFDVSKGAEYLSEAKRVLKPKGRMIMVISLGSLDFMVLFARQAGFRVFAKILSEEQTAKSPAEYIKKRSTLKGRNEIFEQDLANLPGAMESARFTTRKYPIRDLADVHLPVAMILRK
jgi:DNA modification methylase